MSEAKHTPGPWAMPDSGQGRISKVGDNGGWTGLIAIADCGDYARSRPEGLANARLIAAAPDLLDALRSIIKSLADQDDEGMIEHAEPMIAARAAIAKATGQKQ